MHIKILLFITVVTGMMTACSAGKEVTSHDRQYIFLPSEIEALPAADYRLKTFKNGRTYVFLTNYTELNGFTGMYGATLVSPSGREIKFQSSLNIQSTVDRAKELYRGMVPESASRLAGRMVKIDPAVYGADQAALYVIENEYFHFVLRSSRAVYSLLIDGLSVEEWQVRKNLIRKLGYIRQHADSLR